MNICIIRKSGTLLIFLILISCADNAIKNEGNVNNRSEILQRNFSNSEVKSIEIVEIKHPMLGGVIDIIKLNETQKEDFLKKFDRLQYKGVYKCGAKYIVRLIFKSDTLKLKVCGTMVSNRMKDIWYELPDGKSIINYSFRSRLRSFRQP